MKEYWELYITQGKNKVWLKTYEDKEYCFNDMIKIAKIIQGEIYYVRHIEKEDCTWYDFGSHTTFFEIEKGGEVI